MDGSGKRLSGKPWRSEIVALGGLVPSGPKGRGNTAPGVKPRELDVSWWVFNPDPIHAKGTRDGRLFGQSEPSHRLEERFPPLGGASGAAPERLRPARTARTGPGGSGTPLCRRWRRARGPR